MFCRHKHPDAADLQWIRHDSRIRILDSEVERVLLIEADEAMEDEVRSRLPTWSVSQDKNN
ncbi:MAG: hypothetical protein AAF670_15810, partial [Planctomycetota bacterium]